MSSARLVVRSARLATRSLRPLSTTPSRCVNTNDRHQDTAEQYRKFQMEKPLNPHMTNTTSTIANDMPSIGKDNAPPELITNVDPNFTPKDSVPENTERMTGGTQADAPKDGKNADLDVGEIDGGTFKVEPLRRTGEDDNTMRARLIYQSRKRGTLESDLLLSTFADANLGRMTSSQLKQYDIFLDENDWDIYYWVTQEPTPTSMAYAEGAGPEHAAPEAQGQNAPGQPEAKAPDGGPASFTDNWRQNKPRSGEWAQTVGTFKPAYRPVPQRWKNSEVLAMLRKHVEARKAGGNVHDIAGPDIVVESQGKGMAFMPELRNFDRP
ncbi:Succinate dehydrogenase assembly factor 2 mitochondrial [Oleoguttula sp. CCFEE 5521]